MGTLLLISFATAVSNTVMNFGSAQVEDQAQCAIDINMKLAIISSQEDICVDNTKNLVRYTIENGKNINIDGLTINIIGVEKTESKEFPDAKIVKAGSYSGKAPYDKTTAGDIRQIKIIPTVTFSDTPQICTEKALVIEKDKIKQC